MRRDCERPDFYYTNSSMEFHEIPWNLSCHLKREIWSMDLYGTFSTYWTCDYSSMLAYFVNAGYRVDTTLIERFMGTTWGPSGDNRTQVSPTLVPRTLLSGYIFSMMFGNHNRNFKLVTADLPCIQVHVRIVLAEALKTLIFMIS